MPRINLLPWREEQRVQKNKEFISLLVIIALLACVAVGATLFYFNNKLNDQKAANELIRTENEKLDTALKEIETLEQRKEEIIARMKVIQDLQGKRPIPVRVWDDLARAIPEMLYLTKLERKGDQLILSGKAENPNIVSKLINNLDRSRWMGNSSVQFIEKNDEEKTANTNNKDKPQIIYPEDSYVGFQVTTVIQMSANSANKPENGIPVADNTQAQEQQVQMMDNTTASTTDASQTQANDDGTETANDMAQAQTSDNATATSTDEAQAKQTDNNAIKETENRSQEPVKAETETTNKSPAKQENVNKSQATDSDKEKAKDDNTNNSSQNKKSESSDKTVEEDAGGDAE